MGFPKHNLFIDWKWRFGNVVPVGVDAYILCQCGPEVPPLKVSPSQGEFIFQKEKWIWNWNYYLQTMIISSWLLTKKKNTNCHIVINHFFTIFNSSFPCSMIFCHFCSSSSRRNQPHGDFNHFPPQPPRAPGPPPLRAGPATGERSKRSWHPGSSVGGGWEGGGFLLPKWGKKLPFQKIEGMIIPYKSCTCIYIYI